MVTLSNADNALRSFYLSAVTESLNMKINPFLAKIEKTSENIVGKDIRKTFADGYNGGVASGTEDGTLPTAKTRQYREIIAPLKNFYGTLEISDKAIRTAASNEKGFVNLLNEEMQTLINSAKCNFGRMLFGNGSGVLSKLTAVASGNSIFVDGPQNFIKGMHLCVKKGSEYVSELQVVSVDRDANNVIVEGNGLAALQGATAGSRVYLEGARDADLTGLEAFFDPDIDLYNGSVSDITGEPYQQNEIGEISEEVIQKAMDKIEEASGRRPNYIICSWGVRRALQAYYKQYNIMLPTMTLENGETALNFNGVPIVVDKFCPEGTMYLLNTDAFKLYQLCDWEWLETEDGKILKQIPGKAAYSATLVKYAELICEDTAAQGKLWGITVE